MLICDTCHNIKDILKDGVTNDLKELIGLGFAFFL